MLNRVLIADDHEVTRRGVRELIREGFDPGEITEVGSGTEVLQRVRDGGWDLVLLDVRMPGPSIIEVIRSIRELEPEVPLLVLTALTEVEYAIETMKAGANGFIQKHRAADELLEAVRSVMERRTYLHPSTAQQIAAAVIDPEQEPLHSRLSSRELDILRRIATGQTVKEIGADLEISEKTVATYVGRIRSKTGLSSHVEITRYALRHKLVE